jgi:nicotinamide-nucleotide amidase
VIHSEGENPPDVEQKLLETENKIRNLVGEYIYGEGTMKLEEAVARLLEQYNITISTAESCTGGMLGSMLTNVPGISRFYREGIISYSNEAKVALADVPKALIAAKGAVSDEVARALAEGVRKKAEADLSVAITGIAGPTGGTQEKPVGLVYIAVTDRNMTESREFRFSGDRHTIRERASLTALNMLRLHILENMPPAPPHV